MGESPGRMHLGWQGPAGHTELLPFSQSIFSEDLRELSGIKTGLKLKGFGSVVQGGFEFGTEAIGRGPLSTLSGRKLMRLPSLIFAFGSETQTVNLGLPPGLSYRNS